MVLLPDDPGSGPISRPVDKRRAQVRVCLTEIAYSDPEGRKESSLHSWPLNAPVCWQKRVRIDAQRGPTLRFH